MPMKPAGPERNRQIAELMGECYCLGDIYIHGNLSGNTVKCSKCGNTFLSNDPPNKDYTDMATAMELWEEMEFACYDISLSTTRVNRDGRYGIKLQTFTAYPQGCTPGETHKRKITFSSESKTDAISGAYVKWREHER